MINEKYSHQGFPYHGLSLRDRPASEFNDTEIIGSCFYQEWIEGESEVVKDIFPDGMKGVTFKGCNLDNVFILKGNSLEGCTNKTIQVKNDLSDWILDKDLNPTEPMDKKERLAKGISIDPKDIPLKKFTTEEREILMKVKV